MRAMALTLCAMALVVAGCGESEEDKYVERYKPLNERLIVISQEISDSLAGSELGGTLGARFDLQIAQLETVNNNIENLDPPEELRDESRALTQRIDASVETLRKISTAVQEGRKSEAETATVELASRAQAVNEAQERMARATGAKVR